MSKGGGKQVTTNSVDKVTQGHNQEIYNRFRDASKQPFTQYGGPTSAGLDPQSVQAGKYFQGGLGLGQQGQAALGGDQAAFGHFFNPYQQNVTDQVRNQYGRLADQATMGLNDEATRAGAFGGSRQGVAQGVALGEIGRGLGEQVSQLQYQGFNDAMGRAQQAANFGMGSAQNLASSGQYARDVSQAGMSDNERKFNEQRDWQARQAELLKEGVTGLPYGTTSSVPKQGGGLLGGILGAGATFAGLGGVKGLTGLFSSRPTA